MSARDEVLSRVRAALAGGAPTRPPARPPTHLPRGYRVRGEHEPGDSALLDLLADRLLDYRATVRRCAPDDLPATVVDMLAGAGVARIAVPHGLPTGWLGGWPGTALTDSPDGALDSATLDGLDGVLTGCAVAIAETGTLVLDASADQGRRAITLVPDYHLVVVRAEQVVESVPEGLARLDPHRPLTMISGPSATSDIELNRVEGVHGPRTVAVILTRMTGNRAGGGR